MGYNPKWKQNINIGRKNNQNFVYVPFKKLVEQIKYKAKLVGMEVIIVKEWYTSKVSALDLEPICKRKKYAGERINRGLFKTKNNILINADVNACLNIMRKVIGDDFIQNLADIRCWLSPKVWKITPKNVSIPKSSQSRWDIGLGSSPLILIILLNKIINFYH